MPRIDCEITDLPEPLSPTRATVWPDWNREAHAPDRLDHALVGEEVDRQVLDLQERCGHGAPPNRSPAGQTRAAGWLPSTSSSRSRKAQPGSSMAR